jgi:hypothetical protein
MSFIFASVAKHLHVSMLQAFECYATMSQKPAKSATRVLLKTRLMRHLEINKARNSLPRGDAGPARQKR